MSRLTPFLISQCLDTHAQAFAIFGDVLQPTLCPVPTVAQKSPQGCRNIIANCELLNKQSFYSHRPPFDKHLESLKPLKLAGGVMKLSIYCCLQGCSWSYFISGWSARCNWLHWIYQEDDLDIIHVKKALIRNIKKTWPKVQSLGKRFQTEPSCDKRNTGAWGQVKRARWLF